MDDLDHSMHIAEFDWSCFYDQSEECCLLQASLAPPDNLSDTDDAEDSTSASRADQEEALQRSEVNGDKSGSSSAGETSCVESSEEPKESTAHVQEENHDQIPTSTQEDAVQPPGDSSTPIKEDEHVHTTQSENSRQQTDLLGVNETVTPGRRAVGEDGGRAERERWFVTVNYSPARPRPRGVSVKKKRRQKNSSKSRRAKGCRPDRCDEEESGEGRSRAEERREERREERSCQGAESPSDLSAVGDTMSEEEAVRAGDQPEAGSLETVRSSETFTPKVCSQEERTEESKEESQEESQEVSSVHTCDSDCYFSAAESMGDTEHLLGEYPQLLESTKPQRQVSMSTQDVESQHSHSAPCCEAAAAHSGRYESTNAGLAVTFPSADHKGHEIPDDFSTSGAELHRRSDSVRNISTSVSSSGDQLSPGTDLTGTPCSTADDPEMHAGAAGQSRTVFAISAFWDEMEKLTINDILHLRMSENLPQSEARESQAVNVNASVTDRSCPTHTGQCSTSDAGLMDLSDTADSDYFTQAEESKPDRSSCEVSTSDFEDECWQFIQTDRNCSQDRTGEQVPFSSLKEKNVDEESLSSEGRGTPVPSLEDFSGQGFEDEESYTFSQQSRPGLMRKSKTMSDVRALGEKYFTDPLSDGRLFFSRCQSEEETRVLGLSDSLDTLTSASKYDTDVLGEQHPELLEYFSLDDKSNPESWCLEGCGPADLSVVSVFDQTLRDQVSFSVLLDSLCSIDRPIPIFSCPQYVRGITVPKMDYLLLRTLDKVDDFPRLRVLSGSLTLRGWTSSWRTPSTMNRFHTCDVLTEGHAPAASSSPVLGEAAAQHHIVETKETAVVLRGHGGVFSALKQSDMCLVCIAFASWVLTSSDPDNADAWKAALLANVSALSAIQYLRHYVKKRRPLQEDPR